MRMTCSFASHGGDPAPTNRHLHDGEKLEIETANHDAEACRRGQICTGVMSQGSDLTPFSW